MRMEKTRERRESTGSLSESDFGERMFDSVSGSPSATRDFDLVRPACVQVMSDPTLTNLSQLSALIPQVSAVIEPCLLDYIVYPLSHHLKRNMKYSREVRIALYNCLKLCVNKWEMETFPCFIELYQFFMMSLCEDEDAANYDKSLSEEMTEYIVSTLHALLEKSVVRHRKRFYSDRYIAAVGHGVCILLQVVNEETVKSLRICCIRTVALLIKGSAGEADGCHRIFKFLPGLATTFIRCCSIKGGRYQVEIIKESLEALRYALSICISFETKEDVEVVDNNILFALIEISGSLVLHYEPTLRRSLAEFSISLLRETDGKLQACNPIFWNNVMILCSDEEQNISSLCIKYLHTHDAKAKVAIDCTFKNTLYDLRKALVQRKVGEDQKCNQTAKKAAASFNLKQFKATELRSLLPRVTELMSTCIRLDIEIKKETPEDLILLRTCKKMCHWMATNNNWFEFLNAFNDLLDACNTVEEISSIRSAGLIKCMNEVLYHLSSTSDGRDTLKRSVMSITTRYIRLLTSLPKTIETAVLESTPNAPSTPVKLIENPKYIQGNAVHNSCLLEGLAILAKLDPDYVTPEAITRILEYAGVKDTEYTSVAQTAVKTLETMGASSGQSMREYLAENLDLIMSDIGVRAMSLKSHPHTADALVFLAEYFDFSNTMFVSFVESIFTEAAQVNYKKESQEMFCRIFYAFILSLWNYYYKGKAPQPNAIPVTPKKKPSLAKRMCDYQASLGMKIPKSTKPEEPRKPCPSTSIELVGKFKGLNVSDTISNSKFSPAGINPQLADAEVEEETLDSDDDPEPPPPKYDTPASPEVSMAARIARIVINNLPQPDRGVKLISMDILIKSIQIVQVHEDSLLPLAHQIWQNLRPRFAESDYVVVRKAFDLLLAMCTSSGTFLTRRTVDEIFPVLASYLKSLGEQSRHIDKKTRVYYTYTQAYKLQLTMLKGMAQLCQAMDIQEQEMDDVVNGCLTYLPEDQHKNLREAAKQLIIDLGNSPMGSAVKMKLLANELVELPIQPSNPAFKTLPPDLTNHAYCKTSALPPANSSTPVTKKKKKLANSNS